MARSIRKIVSKALWGRENTALREEHNVVLGELDDIKTQFAALLAKLDADTGTTDDDYASTLALTATEAKEIS